jgi:4-amino-4-deoxy-L-arabinose transferase-like glycosyltransferase
VTIKSKHVIFAGAALLMLWGVWGYDLWAPDEPYFGEGAREMVVDGQWAVPHVNGDVTTDKPPLFFWLIALFSLPIGKVSSLTARLPSVLAGLGTVGLTIRLGRRQGGAAAGALAGIVLMTTYLFWDKARTAQIDALLCCLILVALSAFESFRAGTADGRRAGLLFWTAAALAVLAKGPVGFLVPAGIALIRHRPVRNRPARAARPAPPGGCRDAGRRSRAAHRRTHAPASAASYRLLAAPAGSHLACAG